MIHQDSVTESNTLTNIDNQLRAMNIREYLGTRYSFLVKWFDKLREMDKAFAKYKMLSFIHIKSVLAKGLLPDSKQISAFTKVEPAKDKFKALAEMKSPCINY